ncbi:hypothetical protein ACVJMY_007297 [Bradyrhizobium diazoefficiens]
MSGARHDHARLGDGRGFIVVVVLWMLAALAALAR